MRRVKSKYFVLLNNDTIVDKFWLKRLVGFAQRKKDGAVFQPKIKLSYDQKRFDYAGACGGYIDYLKVGKLIEDNMTTPREYFGLVAR